MPEQTIYFRYKISWHGFYGIADNGIQLDSMVRDVLSRVDEMQEVTIEVIFGGTTTA